MILLGKPYVSPLLAQTAAELNIPVVKVGDVQVPLAEELNWQTEHDFFEKYDRSPAPLLTSSENALEALERHLPAHRLVQAVSMFKNKARFRKWLADLYPSFTYREFTYAELLQVPVSELPFPLVVKPTVGYASLGVYRVATAEEWPAICKRMERDMREARTLYPASVLNSGHFLVEEWIEGEEYAVDAYFQADGEPVVLNVLKRMFSHEGDTSDRIYYTSKQVLQEALEPVTAFLRQVGKLGDFGLFPLHVEVRISSSGALVPIEVNPMRFAGIGTCDLVQYAYGYNLYEHFLLQTKPDWEGILAAQDDSVYSFFCAELPVEYHLRANSNIREQEFRSHFSDVLEFRSMQGMDPTTFAVVFYRSQGLEENKRLLHLDLTQFVQRDLAIHS